MQDNQEQFHKQFLIALSNENISKLVDLINKPGFREYLKTANQYGFYPLHTAIESENFKAVELLLNNGAEFLRIQETVDTPLHSAASKGNLEIFKLLYQHSKGSFSTPNENGDSPLHLAARYGHTEILKYINETSKKNGLSLQDAFSCNSSDEDPVTLAIQNGHLEALKVLINLVDHAYLNNPINEMGDLHIHLAAKYGTPEMIDFFITNGLNFHSKNNAGKTALQEAVANGKTEMVKNLVEKGFQLDVYDNTGGSLLHLAAKNGNAELAQYLIKKGCNLNAVDKYGNTPLHIAAVNFNEEFIKTISCNWNFDPTVIDNNLILPNVAAIKQYNKILKDNPEKRYLEKAQNTISFLNRALEVHKQFQPFLSLQTLKGEFSVPELIKSRSRPYNPKHLKEMDELINKSWEVAEKAAEYGDISLKANLIYFASQIAHRLNEGRDDNKEINFIKAHSVNSSDDFIAGGYCDKDNIVVAYTSNILANPADLGTIMHEVLHDTIREVYQNDALLSRGNESGTHSKSKNSLDAPSRQLKAYAKDLRELYNNIEMVSNPQNTIRAEELSKKFGDIILPSFKRVINEGKSVTKANLSGALGDLYVNKGVKGNRIINISEPYDNSNKQILEFNELTAQQEMYTYLIGQKTQEYTKDIARHGKVTKDSASVKYAPNITKSFERDLISDIFPALEENLKLLENGNGIRIEGTKDFLKQIEEYKTKHAKQEAIQKPSSNRVEEAKELKSWAKRFRSKKLDKDSLRYKASKNSKTLEDIRSKKDSSKNYADKVSTRTIEGKS
jgi:ankyrin repeat protein